jgi:YidC/Oxa1 family membrane protein insertase
MFDFIAEILGAILAFFYDLLVPPFSEGWGYGLAIIGLTITINILVFPLTLKQTRSTRAFAAIQPKIKKLQAEFKDDPPEMQRRLMELQKEAGATPGGCLLPMLVQMPIWFGLFTLLREPLGFIDPNSAMGLALQDDVPAKFLGMLLGTSPAQALQEGFITAIPYLIMMAIMVATQYVQQWHSTYGQVKPSGQPGAGATQAITKIMPLFIGFISYNFPAGLVLYWATSNLFRLGQQVLIFKLDGRPSAPVDDEPDEKKPAPTEDAPASKPQQGADSKRRRRRRR